MSEHTRDAGLLPSPADAGEPGIKALEWERRTERFWKADPFRHVMHYGIEAHQSEFSWYLGLAFMGRVDTFDEAKAAAQADFEARIRSALVGEANG